VKNCGAALAHNGMRRRKAAAYEVAASGGGSVRRKADGASRRRTAWLKRGCILQKAHRRL